MLSLVSHTLSIIKYVVLKKIIFSFSVLTVSFGLGLDSASNLFELGLDSASNLFELGLDSDSIVLDLFEIPKPGPAGQCSPHRVKS